MFDKKFNFLLLLFLSSCISLSKHDQTQNILSTPSIDTSIDESLSTSFFSKGNWPEANWWLIFESEQLNLLIEKALAANPSIQGIEQRIEAAKQVSTVARSRLFPLLFFDATDTWEYLSKTGLYRQLNPTIPLNVNLIDFTLAFTYEFDFWGKYRNLFKAAIGQERAEEAETAQVKLITTTALAQAYFALKTNLIRKQLYQELLQVREHILDLQNLLFENLLSSKFPPLLFEEQVLEARKLVFNIEEELSVNRHLINILTGHGPDELLIIDNVLNAIPQTLVIPENLSLDLLSRRPDLMAQIWRVESLAHDVGAAKADFYPNVNLGAFVGFESGAYSTLFKNESLTRGTTPAIHLPIFTAGAIRANIKAKKARFDQAVYEYNNLILKSFQEVSDLMAFGKSVFQQKQAQEGIVENAEARYELTLIREQHGLDNALTRYFFEETVIQKRLEDTTLLYNQYVAAIKLTKALGGGYTSLYTVPIQAQAKEI